MGAIFLVLAIALSVAFFGIIVWCVGYGLIYDKKHNVFYHKPVPK